MFQICSGEAQVEQQTSDGQTGNGCRGKQSQHAQGFRSPELDGHGGGTRDQEILQVGQGEVHGPDDGGVGDVLCFFHRDAPF